MKEESKKNRSVTKKVLAGVVIGAVAGAVIYTNREKILTFTINGGKFIWNGIKSCFKNKIENNNSDNL